jgi:flagellar hook-associated protein 2
MPTITASSGLIDVNNIVTQLMQVERAPLQKLDQTRTKVQTKLSAIGQIKSALSTLQDAARSLGSLTTGQAAKANSSDPTTVSASASAGSPIGNYGVRVDRLAQRQSISGPALASANTVVGGGSLSIQLGSVNASGAGFTADPLRPAINVTVDAGATLTEVVSAINSASAGVVATIVKDGANSRLLIRSTDSGLSHAFSIQASDSDGANNDASGLSMAAFDPLAPGSGATTLNESAQDAEFRFGGMTLSSPGNSIDGIVQNTTINLHRVSTTTVDVNVAIDTEAVRKAADQFVTAYNELNSKISEATKYDPGSKTAGALQGSYSIVTIQNQMRALVASTASTGVLTNLSAAGIETQRDGSLLVNDSKFTQVASTPRNLQVLFAFSDPLNSANSGIARRLTEMATQLLGSDGVVGSSTETLQRRISAIELQKTRIESRLLDVEKRLRSTYSNLDAKVTRISNQGSQFTTST